MLFRFVQFQNAKDPIEVTLFGIVILVTVHLINAL